MSTIVPKATLGEVIMSKSDCSEVQTGSNVAMDWVRFRFRKKDVVRGNGGVEGRGGGGAKEHIVGGFRQHSHPIHLGYILQTSPSLEVRIQDSWTAPFSPLTVKLYTPNPQPLVQGPGSTLNQHGEPSKHSRQDPLSA